MNRDFVQAGYLIVAAMISDTLDGRVARYFHVSGEFGKELDSLCDLASFGVAPAVLAYAICLKDFGWAGWIIAVAFAVCGALRLARFNVNAAVVKGYFVGLPIPAAGCFLAAFVIAGFKIDGYLFAIMVLLLAYLMISTIKHPDFKGKGEKLRKIPIFITLAICAYVFYLNHAAIVFVPFLGFAVFGILNTLFGIFDKPNA
jgi:CDP-diacylglycerol--serine O-phosphatidyltransferase